MKNSRLLDFLGVIESLGLLQLFKVEYGFERWKLPFGGSLGSFTPSLLCSFLQLCKESAHSRVGTLRCSSP